jgi:hypothetical protein
VARPGRGAGGARVARGLSLAAEAALQVRRIVGRRTYADHPESAYVLAGREPSAMPSTHHEDRDQVVERDERQPAPLKPGAAAYRDEGMPAIREGGQQ